jgi:hypothetical protein
MLSQAMISAVKEGIMFDVQSDERAKINASTYLNASDYDWLVEYAARHQCGVSTVLRALILAHRADVENGLHD